MIKKAQSQIITTVLIILLVLAAIVIVWQVVNTTVSGGAREAESIAACIGTNLEIISAKNTSSTDLEVTVSRGQGDSDLTSMKFIVERTDGTQECNVDQEVTDLPALGQKTFTVTGCTLTSGSRTVRIAPVISGNQCDVLASKIITV